MKRKVLVGIAFVYLTVAIFSVAPSVSAVDQINFGQIVTDSIDNPVQVKTYSFSATANDQFLLRVSRTEGVFYPYFRLYSPNGKKIAEDYNSGPLVEGSGTLPDSGTYQLLICDKGGKNIGKFGLQIVRTSGPTPITNQIEIKGLSILDIQKSSETAPEINIKPIEEQILTDNTTVLLGGTASSDSGIRSVTVNGQYAGAEYWSVPLALSLGDNNIVIVSTGNDGSATIEKVRLTATTPELESNRSSHVPYFVALIGAIATIAAAIIIARYTKKEK